MRNCASVFRLTILLAFLLFATGCATTAITPDDLITQPQPMSTVPDTQRFKGTVNVQFLVMLTIPAGQPWELHPYINRFMLKTAVEKAITQNSLFSSVAQNNADYILDIWVHWQELEVPIMGFGDFKAHVRSFWRLTRVRDGKMFGNYVEGHGVISSGMGPSTRSMVAAIQNMIQIGMTGLSEQSQTPLSALSPEGVRPHIEPWVANVKQNWRKLRIGMTLDEVENAIGPVRTSGAMLYSLTIKETIGRSQLNLSLFSPRLAKWEDIIASKRRSYDYECRSGIYTLVFRDDRLVGWKLY
jgi:hypothetical protein